MKDRELLELAAKAAGLLVTEERGCSLPWTVKLDGKYLPWNPLTCNGDALRLAVKLNIRFAGEWGGKCVALVGVREFAEESSSDADAATRRAITRAAASIGRGEG